MISFRPFALVALLGGLALAVPAAAGPPADEIETCMSCHADKDLTLTFASGETQSLAVDLAAFQGSVHGAKLTCTDCHPGMGEIPHTERSFKSRKEFAAAYRDQCKSCHFDNYTKALDGVHYAVLAKGNDSAPFCLDCHGAHDIAKPNRPRTKVSDTCASCHGDVAEVFAKSVHGRALSKENADVPVCTDCHRSHDIANPHSAGWRLRTTEICGSCHTNKAMMAKYGLSTNVLNSYLSDFHGMSASLYRGQKAPAQKVAAVCVDCHGTHDIRRVREAGSQVLQANLKATCEKCHAGATQSFPAAWLSHYEPSWQRAPLVWLVGVFYKIFIPFVIGGLVLQIVLHLWRVVVNR